MRPVRIRAAAVAGEEAAGEGLWPEDNPYREGTGERLAWERAYFRRVEFDRSLREFVRSLKKRRNHALARPLA